MGADNKKKHLPVKTLISMILQGKTTGEISEETGASLSNVKIQYNRVIARVMDDIDLGYDPRRDSNKSKDFIALREIVRNRRIEEGFKNNLLISIEMMKKSLNQMHLDKGGFIEKGKIIEKMHRHILEIQKISNKG